MNLTLRHSRISRIALLPALCFATGTFVPAAIAQTGSVSATGEAVKAPAAKKTYVSLQTAVDGAKVLQSTVVYRTGDGKTPLKDQARFKVLFDASGKARIERTALSKPDAETLKKNPPALANPALLVFNGNETFEYDAGKKEYLRTEVNSEDTPIANFTPLRQLSLSVRGLAEGPFQNGLDETLDGRKMRVRSIDYGKAGDPHPFIRQRYLIDAETNLLRRSESLMWRGDTPYIYQQFDYSDWKLNPKIDANLFAWQPPSDAKETSQFKKLPPPPPPGLAIGTVAPDFTCIGPDGKTIQLSDLRGKTVVIDFWATWCLPCLFSMPHLQSVYERVKDNKDVAILAICIGDLKTSYDTWVDKNKTTYSFPTAYDPAGRDATKNLAATAYKANMIPAQYIIDKDGKIAAAFSGNQGKDDHRLEEALAKLGISLPAPTKEASAKP